MARPEERERLAHILEAIELIEHAISDIDEAGFAADRLLRLGVERCLEIISEASRHIPDNAKSRHPQIPWRRVADIGNRLRHAYHDTDSALLWQIATTDLGELKRSVQSMQDEDA